MRYSYPAIKVNDTVRLELASGKDPTKVDGRGLHLPSDGRVHREERPLQACAWVALARHQRCEAAVSLRGDLRPGDAHHGSGYHGV
jgi:hypothetical protein